MRNDYHAFRQQTHMMQLGSTSPGLYQGLNIGLSAIPGVGPALASIAGILESIFGGGDPTPEWELTTKLLEARVAIAQLHTALGIADDFHLSGSIGSGTNEAQIREAYNYAMGVESGTPWSRETLYTAIQNLGNQAQQLAQQAHDAALMSQMKAMLPQQPTSSPSATEQATATPQPIAQASFADPTMLIVGGLGVVLLVALATRK